MTDTNKEVTLERGPCIHYLLRFRKGIAGVRTLVNSGSKINAMTPAYAAKLVLKVQITDIGAQKIDGFTLETFRMVPADF